MSQEWCGPSRSRLPRPCRQTGMAYSKDIQTCSRFSASGPRRRCCQCRASVTAPSRRPSRHPSEDVAISAQWDPDRSLHFKALPFRSMQVELSGEAVVQHVGAGEAAIYWERYQWGKIQPSRSLHSPERRHRRRPRPAPIPIEWRRL
ncbi:DUF4291 family protein [Micromonospora saelicesensis]|uniref:DUF4291 family protein n=1 Tax=Micromonospora saelicesensis TaxID=285676 RepID=UPI0035A24BD9